MLDVILGGIRVGGLIPPNDFNNNNENFNRLQHETNKKSQYQPK
jgi:hypothetical protein